MAVPKRFKFKTKKKTYKQINNNSSFIKAYYNKKLFRKIVSFIIKVVILTKIYCIIIIFLFYFFKFSLK